jgi:multidrug efflux pump subunit AcrA (membrane-fusion protein)
VVTLGTDYGHDVEIKTGLKAEDKIVMNPPDSIVDGQAVAIVTEATKGN